MPPWLKLRLLLDPVGGDGNGNPPNLPTPPNNEAAIEKARLEERAKLGTQLADLVKKVETLSQQVTALSTDKQALEKSLSEQKTAYETLKASVKPDGGVDIEKAIESAANAALQQQGNTLQQEIARLAAQLAEEQRKREAAELAQTRLRVIEEHGGTSALIPELVVGRSEEELRAAAQNSKNVLARTLQSVGVTVTPPAPPTPPLPGNPPPAPGPRTVPTTVTRLPLAEFAKQREQLKAAALARAQGT